LFTDISVCWQKLVLVHWQATFSVTGARLVHGINPGSEVIVSLHAEFINHLKPDRLTDPPCTG